MRYDFEIVKRLGYTCKQIEDRVHYLVNSMEQMVKYGNGFRVSSQIENIIKLKLPNFPPSTWSGKQFLNELPHIDCGWVMVDQQQAIVDEHFRVSRVIWMGAQLCPFQLQNDHTYYGYVYGNRDFVIENLISKEIIAISSLTLHMISAHFCFQASKHPYRLHPKKLIRVLFL